LQLYLKPVFYIAVYFLYRFSSITKCDRNTAPIHRPRFLTFAGM